MKMAGCSEGKRQDIRNYLEIYLSLKNTINQDCSYFTILILFKAQKTNSFYSFLNLVFSKYRA
jgi:hypothetical protein